MKNSSSETDSEERLETAVDAASLEDSSDEVLVDSDGDEESDAGLPGNALLSIKPAAKTVANVDDDDDDDDDGIKLNRKRTRSKNKTHRLVDDDDEDEEDSLVVDAGENKKNSSNNATKQHDVSLSSPAPSKSTPAIQIAKYFDDDLFVGKVIFTKYDDDDEHETLWHILYEDGDEEDFDEQELEEGIALFRKFQQDNEDDDDYHDGTMLMDTDDEKEQKDKTRANQRRTKRRLLDRRAAKLSSDDNAALSSSSEDDRERPAIKKPTRRRKRKMMSESMEAKKAQAEQRERARERKQWRASSEGINGASAADAIIINEARPHSEQEIKIAPVLGSQLKPHQIDGVRFLWEGLIHSIAASNKEPGRGSILAHSSKYTALSASFLAATCHSISCLAFTSASYCTASGVGEEPPSCDISAHSPLIQTNSLL